MCSVFVELDESDIFAEWVATADCGWSIHQEDTHEGRREADRRADNHEATCEK